MSFKRRRVRERVMQMLYAYELSGNSPDFIMSNYLTPFKTDKDCYEFGRSLFMSVIEHDDECEKMIARKIKHYDVERLAVIDRIILKMGICELKYFPEIPPKVTINEAIEIAKKYSTEKSGQFINGVLDAIYIELKETNQLNKTGRGLIDENVRKQVD